MFDQLHQWFLSIVQDSLFSSIKARRLKHQVVLFKRFQQTKSKNQIFPFKKLNRGKQGFKSFDQVAFDSS